MNKLDAMCGCTETAMKPRSDPCCPLAGLPVHLVTACMRYCTQRLPGAAGERVPLQHDPGGHDAATGDQLSNLVTNVGETHSDTGGEVPLRTVQLWWLATVRSCMSWPWTFTTAR